MSTPLVEQGAVPYISGADCRPDLQRLTGAVNPEQHEERPMLNIDTCRSYATEANLMKALEKLGFDKDKPLVVRNREGRFTAVFGFDLSGIKAHGGYIALYANAGFMTID